MSMLSVALFARAWIEMAYQTRTLQSVSVALFARAWIEICKVSVFYLHRTCRPLCEGVD